MIGELLKRYRFKIFLCSMLSVISALCGMVIMKLISTEISNLETGSTEIAYSFQLFLIAVVAVVVFGFLAGFLLQKLTETVAFELRTTMVRRFLLTSYERVEQIGGHRVFTTMTQDVGNIAQGLSILPSFVHSFVTVLLCLGYLFYTSWQLFLVVFGFLIGALIVAGIIIRIGMRYEKALRANHDALFNSLKSLVDGRKELSSNQKRKYFFFNNVVEPVCRDMRENVTRTAFAYTFLNNWTTAQIFCIIAVVVYGSHYVIGDVTQAIVVTFSIVILYMIEPLIQLVDMLEDTSRYRISYSRIKKLELAEDEGFDKLAENREPLEWSNIVFKDVEYLYEKQDEDDYSFHVGPLSLTFDRGDIVFLTGGNGSGKTTFAKLLVGLYEKNAGKIFLDEKEIAVDLSSSEYRTLFSTIFSDFYVFDHVLNKSGVLAEDSLIDDYIRKMKLENVVIAKEGLLSSTDLSHGQRKRLALLASNFENADICVYDEWAADQDPIFRAYFYTELLPELKKMGKTVIVITHDDRYFSIADHLVKFESGYVISNSRGKGDIHSRVLQLKGAEELVA